MTEIETKTNGFDSGAGVRCQYHWYNSFSGSMNTGRLPLSMCPNFVRLS
ncbi:MAG: hypothetical protein ACLTER_13020 [Ruminococcus sp.]